MFNYGTISCSLWFLDGEVAYRNDILISYLIIVSSEVM